MGLPTLALLALTTVTGLAPTQDVAFEETLAQVETLIGVGRWAQARRALLDDLERREGDPRVVARLVEVQEMLRLCSFGAAYTPPAPADVVAGELVRYQPDRGELHLRYRVSDGRAPADFVVAGDGSGPTVHPLEWNGPLTLRLTWTRLEDVLGVLVCADDEAGYSIGVNEILAMVRISKDDSFELLEPYVELDMDAPHAVEVHVGARQIEVLLDGARVFAHAKPEGMQGQLGLSSFAGIDSVELEGKAEVAWIQNRVDDAGARARIAHDELYDARADLPAWLRPYDLSPPPGAQDASAAKEFDPFAAFEAAPRGPIAKAREFLDADNADAGIAWVESLSEAELVPGLADWMRGLFLLRAGGTAEGLAALDAALATDRARFELRLAHAEVLWHEDLSVAAEAASQALLAEFPDRARAYELLGAEWLVRGRRAQIPDLLARAAAADVRSRELQELERVLVRAARGPSWSRTHEYVGRHYVVRSDLSRALCLAAAQELDAAHRMFESQLGRIDAAPDERLPVYLFSGQGTYLLYTRDLTGALPVHTAGLYSPALQQLLIWNLPRRKETMLTVRHEGFHQFLDRRAGPAPTWLHEGLAELFSHSRLERGHWVHGDPIPEHLARLRRPGFAWTPLPELLRIEPETFYDASGRYYAEAWHWVHFLENSDVRNGRRIRTLVDALAAGKGTEAALEAAFPAPELDALDRARREHLRAP